MSRLILWLAVTVCLSATDSLHGQMVRLLPGGGVNVRAPFVRVYVDGNGNTRVRAPFVDIHAPGQGVPPGRYFPGQGIPNNGQFPNGSRPGSEFDVAPGELGSRTPAGNGSRRSNGNRPQPADPNRFPSRSEPRSGGSSGDTVSVLRGSGESELPLTSIGWRDLRRLTRQAAVNLDQQLGRVESGARYKKVLKAGSIRDLLAEDVDSPPDDQTLLELKSIRAEYARLEIRGADAQITRSDEFQRLRNSLDEITKTPLQRQRQLLAANWNRMAEDLNRFRTAEDWKKFLRLPDIVYQNRRPDPDSLRAAIPAIRKMHQRFEKSNAKPAYRLVTELTSFQTTRGNLAAYVQMLERQKPGPAEELPRPKGKKQPID